MWIRFHVSRADFVETYFLFFPVEKGTNLSDRKILDSKINFFR